MLSLRLASAAVMITVMIGLLRLDFWLATEAMLGREGVVLAILAIAVSVVAALELAQMWTNQNRQPSWILSLGTGIMTTIASMPILWRSYPVDCPIGKFGWSLAGIIAALMLSTIYEMKIYPGRTDETGQPGESGGTTGRPGDTAGRIGRSVFAYVYLAMLFGFILPLRTLEQSNALGQISIICLIATVKMSDAFAYFAGKSFGTTKLAPKLSPGKTLQGSLAAPVGGCLAAAIVIFIISPTIFSLHVDRPWWWCLLYGTLVTFAGMIGDLAESLLKRDAACKDSGGILPGLGGLLDVLDSLIFAAPVSYLLWMIH